MWQQIAQPFDGVKKTGKCIARRLLWRGKVSLDTNRARSVSTNKEPRMIAIAAPCVPGFTILRGGTITIESVGRGDVPRRDHVEAFCKSQIHGLRSHEVVLVVTASSMDPSGMSPPTYPVRAFILAP